MTYNGTCAKCGAKGDLEAIYERDCYCHVGCCWIIEVDGVQHVDYPSPGQILSGRLMYELDVAMLEAREHLKAHRSTADSQEETWASM